MLRAATINDLDGCGRQILHHIQGFDCVAIEAKLNTISMNISSILDHFMIEERSWRDCRDQLHDTEDTF